MDALNIILGAVIALAGSVITTIIVIRYQRIEAERKRKWEIEDRTHLEKREVVLKRIDQLEEFTEKIAKAAKEVQFSIIKNYDTEWNDDLDFSKIEPFVESVHIRGLITRLYLPADIEGQFDDLFSYWQKLVDLRLKMKSNLDDGKILENKEIYKEANGINIDDSFGKIITRLDDLRESVS